MTDQGKYIRLAAPAKEAIEEIVALRGGNDGERLHSLCEAWAEWLASRSFYGGPRELNMNSIARWKAPMRATATEGRDAACDWEMQAFNRAVCKVLDSYITAKPNSKAPRAFIEYYVYRTRPVKVIAGRLGLSRQQIYPLIQEIQRAAMRAKASQPDALPDPFRAMIASEQAD